MHNKSIYYVTLNMNIKSLYKNDDNKKSKSENSTKVTLNIAFNKP